MNTISLKAFRLVAIAIVSLLSLPTWAAVSKLTVLPDGGKTEFTAVGRPAMLRIHGESAAPTGELKVDGDQVTGLLTLKLENFNTGIEMRDHHMKEKYLETGKYPDAILKITEMKLPEGAATKTESKVPFRGELTLHGVTKPVDGHADLAPTSKGWKVSSNFQVNIEDYKIPVPSFAGITVASKVDLNVDFEVKREE